MNVTIPVSNTHRTRAIDVPVGRAAIGNGTGAMGFVAHLFENIWLVKANEKNPPEYRDDKAISMYLWHYTLLPEGTEVTFTF